MDFSDESYVRLYTRKTLTWKLLGWEGRAVMHAMLGEFDAAGIFEIRGDAAACVATVTDLPIDLARTGLERLLATETWVLGERAITWPSYEEAQNCSRSDRLRQRESRKRRTERAAGHVTKRDGLSQPVTASHSESQLVTLPPSLPPSAPTLEDARKPARKRRSDLWHFVPADWSPNGSHEAERRRRGWPDSHYFRVLESFRQHEFDRPKSDPDRAFSAWMAREKDPPGVRLAAPVLTFDEAMAKMGKVNVS